MKLLFYAPPLDVYGGIERHLVSLSAAMARSGHSVDLLIASNSLGPALRAELRHPNVRLTECPFPRGKAGALVKGAWLLSQILLRLGSRYDLVYTNGIGAGARLLHLLRRRGVRFLHHHHGGAAPSDLATWSPGYRRLLASSDDILVCGDSIAEVFRREFPSARVTSTTCLFPELFSTAEIVDRPPPSPPLKFGFCGRLAPGKGIETLLALSDDPSLSHVEWHIHGSGPDYPPSLFRDHPRVRYHGAYASVADYRAILQSLDAAVLFSASESKPLALTEALGAGLPFVATDCGEVSALARSAADTVLVRGELTLPKAAEAARELARRLLSGECSAARQRAVYDKCFSPAAIALEWQKLFSPHAHS